MLGNHLIKSWSASQLAFALSSADAELYAMGKAVTRAKDLVDLATGLVLRMSPMW